MIALNDSSIYVSQIKQILNKFNLPQCQIGGRFPSSNKHFIRNNNICYWDSDLNEVIYDKYIYNKSYVNFTSNLKICNMQYDLNTHRYLGKYLRFLRDYHGMNLMCMYNCCDYELLSDNISINFNSAVDQRIKISFDPSDIKYTVLSVPISRVDKYTISTHNYVPVELCISINNNSHEVLEILEDLAAITYMKNKFNDIFLYEPFTKLSAQQYKYIDKTLVKYLDDIRLIIKIPKNLNTSVVVLEGDYINKPDNNFNYFIYKPTIAISGDSDTVLLSRLAENSYLYETLVPYLSKDLRVKRELGKWEWRDVFIESGFKVNSQLLSHENYNSKYLLSDRLVQYLTGNAISPKSEYYEIIRIQKTVDKLRFNSLDYNKYLINFSNLPKDRYYGHWTDADLYELKSLMFNAKLTHNNYDMVGYIDSDFERFFIKEGIDDVQL